MLKVQDNYTERKKAKTGTNNIQIKVSNNNELIEILQPKTTNEI